MLSDWRCSVNIMCWANEHQNEVISVPNWASSTFQSAYKPNFGFFGTGSVFASILLWKVYSELFNESIFQYTQPEHLLNFLNQSIDVFDEYVLKKILKMQRWFYQPHKVYVKTKRNHHFIEYSLNQKWNITFWAFAYHKSN